MGKKMPAKNETYITIASQITHVLTIGALNIFDTGSAGLDLEDGASPRRGTWIALLLLRLGGGCVVKEY